MRAGLAMDDSSDDKLINACRAGDGQAWEYVLNKYERLVFSIALNYGLTREDAADVTQLTFTYLIQNLDTLQRQSNLGAWLSTVARRTTWRALQRTRRESTQEFAALVENDELVDQHSTDTFARWEQIEWLNAGLQQLNQRCRELLLALYFEPHEPTYAEIAARTGVAIGSIGPTRARCLERLRQMLRER